MSDRRIEIATIAFLTHMGVSNSVIFDDTVYRIQNVYKETFHDYSIHMGHHCCEPLHRSGRL